MNDQELAAEARRVAAELSRRPRELSRRPRDLDLIRYAAGLLKEQADRADGRPAAQAAEESNG